MTSHEAHVLRQLDKLGGVWPDQGPRDDQGIEVYIEALIDLDPMLLESAVLQCITSCKFYPKPAEIREAAADLELKAKGVPDPYEAWAIALKALAAGIGHPIAGANNAARSSVPPHVDRAAQAVGGWRVLAMSENLVADRARFIDAYREIMTREISDRQMLPQVRCHLNALADHLSVDGHTKALTVETELREDD